MCYIRTMHVNAWKYMHCCATVNTFTGVNETWRLYSANWSKRQTLRAGSHWGDLSGDLATWQVPLHAEQWNCSNGNDSTCSDLEKVPVLPRGDFGVACIDFYYRSRLQVALCGAASESGDFKAAPVWTGTKVHHIKNWWKGVFFFF